MAADPGVPKPGTKYGPCDVECKHRDCAQSRDTATSVCRFCDRVIGYETRYYRDAKAGGADAHPWVHADCFEDAVERSMSHTGVLG